MRAWLLLAALLLSGCSGGGGGDEAGPGEPGADPGTIVAPCMDAQARPTGQAAADGTCPPLPPVLHIVEVDFDGNLGVYAAFCEGTAQACVPPDGSVVDDETDYLYEHPGATLVAANLTLAWEATSAATDTLAMGAMRMGDNSTEFAHADGMSPLEIQAEGLDVLLDAENLVHVYIYNAKGPIHQGTAGGYATTDQEFHLEGTLTFAIPQ